MKKSLILFVAIVATLAVTSCSKEKVLNRKLDGTWETAEMSLMDEGALDEEEDPTGFGSAFSSLFASFKYKLVYKFETSKKGTGTAELKFVTTGMGITEEETEKADYVLVKDEKIELTDKEDGSKSVLIVQSYDKKKMTLKDEEGHIYNFTKK